MDYAYDHEVRNAVLLDGETVLHLLRPGKKAFAFYQIWLPSILLALVWMGFLVTTLIMWMEYDVPISLAFYIAGTLLVLLLVLAYFAIQKKRYAKKAYYITDRRILLVGGLFHLKYQTLHYRFIGSVEWKRVPFSRLFGMNAYTIHLLMNIGKRLTVSFFSISGTSLLFLEKADDAYRQIVGLSIGK